MYRILSTLSFVCLALALAVIPGAAHAQDESMNDRDVLDLFLPTESTELQLQGSTSINLDDEQEPSGNVFVNYGWFITERQQVGASAVIGITEDGNGDLDFQGYGGPFYRYNLSTGKVAPWVGASLGFRFGDFLQQPDDQNGMGRNPSADNEGPGDYLLELEGGARWFLRRDVSFNVAAGVLYDIENSDLSDVINVRFGFSYFWQ